MDAIRNKVAESGIITIDLETFYPAAEIKVFDIKDYLFMGMILKEKDFREALKAIDWNIYKNYSVGITCTADAIIPMWAYMLLITYLQPVANDVVIGNEEEVVKKIFLHNINHIETELYRDKRIVIKGCGNLAIKDYAYAEITKVLLPVVKTIMYGEPCSTVPVYKRRD